MTERVPVAILGASGLVGQHLVRRLADHPWFDLQALVGRPGGRPRRLDRVWRLPERIPAGRSGQRIAPRTPASLARDGIRLAFSALPSGAAAPIERALRDRGIRVFTNAADLRFDPSTLLLLPEVNGPPARTSLLGGRPRIVANPNCTATGLALALAPVWSLLAPRAIHLTSYQALSGAGFDGWDRPSLRDTVVPFIRGEEEKVAREGRFLLSSLDPPRRQRGTVPILAHCARVPVTDGHLEAITVHAGKAPTLARLRAAWTGFDPLRPFQLPSAPHPPVHLLAEQDRPQPRTDRGAGSSARSRGMAVSVGRVRWDPPYLRLFALVHNAIRGAAGGALLNAEFCHAPDGSAAHSSRAP